MEKIELKNKLFGANVEIVVYGKNIDKKILENAYDEGVRLEKIFNFYDETSELSLLNKKRKSAKKIIPIHDSNIPYLSLSKRKYDKRDLFLIYRNEWLICDEVNFGTNKYSVIELPSELEFLIKISARKV